MAIRLIDQAASRLGFVTSGLADAVASLAGSFVPAPARSGTIAAMLGSLQANFQGQFAQSVTRTGTIAAQLAGASANWQGSVNNTGAESWQPIASPPVFTEGQAGNWSFAAYAPPSATQFIVAAQAAALTAAGISMDQVNKRLVYDGVGGQQVISGVILENPGVIAEDDWQQRISGAGVVWYHDFRSDAEVNAFRWTSAYSGGNDPNAAGTSSPLVQRDTTDSVTGGGCLKLTYVGGNSSFDSVWWRPFSPLTAPGNGKAANDPGAGGTITPRAYQATDGGSQIANFGAFGYYAHPGADMKGGIRDGTEYYLQMRVKMDPRRTISGSPQVGKLTYHSVTNFSLSAQEIVTYSGAFPVAGQGQPNYLRMYSRSFAPVEQWDSLGRPGQQLGHDGSNYGAGLYCDVNDAAKRANCWAWSGGWDTLMYHITPGEGGIENQRIVVYAAHQGETAYTKIWDETYAIFHSATPPEGYNAVIVSIYQNGASFPSEFWHKYDQLIFSKQFIPCPQV